MKAATNANANANADVRRVLMEQAHDQRDARFLRMECLKIAAARGLNSMTVAEAENLYQYVVHGKRDAQ